MGLTSKIRLPQALYGRCMFLPHKVEAQPKGEKRSFLMVGWSGKLEMLEE